MKKILLLMLVFFSSLSLTPAYAAGNTFFFCMTADSTEAYVSEDGQNIEYKEMKSSNGAIVKTLVIDGSTYLPFRFVVEIAGWTEGKITLKTGEANTFQFEQTGSVQRLKLRTANKTHEKEINKDFPYQVAGEQSERIFNIKNIDGSLYVPLRYIADILGAKTGWDSKTGNIYFASSREVMNTFVESNNTLKFSKLFAVSYKAYDNNLVYSSMYMKSDGNISSIEADLKSTESYSCVSRLRKNIYFINDKNFKVYTKREDSNEISEVKFYNTNNSSENITADILLNDGKSLWGIATESAGNVIGKLFRADFDGMNFRYVDDANCYNLIYREYNGNKYIFYVLDDNRTIIRMNTETLQKQIITVYDDGGDGISNIGMLTLGEGNIFYKDIHTGQFNALTFDQNIYLDSYITVNSSLAKNLSKNGGQSIGEVVSLNYDDDNKILYFTAEKTGGLYYYDAVNKTMGSLKTSSDLKTRIAIIKNGYNTYKVFNNSKGKEESILVSVKDDGVTIDGNIHLKR